MKYSSWMEIDRRALQQNIKMFQRVVKPAALMPIIKSNAYGHGYKEVTAIINKTNIWGVGVASLTEALTIEAYGLQKPIVVLSYIDDKIALAIKHKIRLPIYDATYATKIDRIAKRLGKKAYIHLNYDSGGTRLGLTIKDFIKLYHHINKLKQLHLEGIYSWLSESEESTTQYTKGQLNKFNDIRRVIDGLPGRSLKFHVACTAASLNYKQSHHDIIRLGLGLYGLWPSVYTKKVFTKANQWFKIKPALSWHTRIIQVKKVPAGTPISYGRTYKTKSTEKIAVLPIGYWEGYDRLLSNTGLALVNGMACPVRGRICMNLTMIDVSKAGNVKPGTVVTLIGSQGKKSVSVDQLAGLTNTINYEFITRLNPHIPRLLV